MPVISKWLVVTRKARYCGSCDKRIPAKTEAVRMYGAAHKGDPNYAVYVHRECTAPLPTTTEGES